MKVIVVGGGIIGCAVADALQRAGAAVIVLERGRPGEEASSAAAGILAPLGEGRQTLFQDLAVASWRLYPEVAADLRKRTGIDVELISRGTLCPLFGPADIATAASAVHWPLASELGVALLDERETRQREPALSPAVQGALFVAGDHWVNNQRLVVAYAQAAVTSGVELRTGVAVSRILRDDERVIGVTADGEELHADGVVLAAGAWSGTLASSIGLTLPVEPSRGQMLALAHVPAIVSYCVHGRDVYLVPRPAGELLIGATVESVGFRREITAGGIAALLTAATELVPALAELAITRTWSGFRPRSADGLPILGPWPGIEGLWVATGHFRNGILLAPITAQLLTEWILDGKPSIAVPDFLPDRFVRAPGKDRP